MYLELKDQDEIGQL